MERDQPGAKKKSNSDWTEMTGKRDFMRGPFCFRLARHQEKFGQQQLTGTLRIDDGADHVDEAVVRTQRLFFADGSSLLSHAKGNLNNAKQCSGLGGVKGAG
jgi:hypothetical protein